MKNLLKQQFYLVIFFLFIFSNEVFSQEAKNGLPSISLKISDENMEKLRQKRKLALYQRALGAETDDWVKAKVKFNGKKHDAEVRLKGDMMDHWKDPKLWSFKVKLKGDDTFMGMKRFALQHPERRAYMGEWYYHQLFEHIDSSIVTINYKFVNVSLNGEDLPLYVLEENIDAKVVERNEQRASLVLKFDADKIMFKNGNLGFNKLFFGVEPTAYQMSKVKASPALSKQFRIAQNLLQAFRLGKLTTSQVFDIEKLACHFAMSDLMGNRHSTSVINMVFYYNPITSLLEPIPYDNSKVRQLVKLRVQEATMPNTAEILDWMPAIFSDEAFLGEYIEKLTYLSKKENLDAFFAKTEKEAAKYISLLKKSNSGYKEEAKDLMYKNQHLISQIINGFKNNKHFAIQINHKSQNDKHIEAKIKNKYGLPLVIKEIHVGESVFALSNTKIIQCSGKLRPYAKTSLKLTKGDLKNVDWNAPVEVTYSMPADKKSFTQKIALQKYIDDTPTHTHLNFIDDVLAKNKKQTLSQIFDFESIAQQMALYDILGYKPASMLQDIRLVYDNKKKKIVVKQPTYDKANIALLGSTNKLYGSNCTNSKFTKDTPISSENFMQALYLEPAFATIYMETLAKINKAKELKADKITKLNANIDVSKWIKFTEKEAKAIFGQNKEMLNHIFNVRYAANAFFNKYQAGKQTANIGISNLIVLPIEIISANINGNIPLVPAAENLVIYPVNDYQGDSYTNLDFVVKHMLRIKQGTEIVENTAKFPWDTKTPENIEISYRILGTQKYFVSKLQTTPKYAPYFVENDIMSQGGTMYKMDFVKVDRVNKKVNIKKGNWTLNETLFVPKDFLFRIEAGTTINLKQNAKIISRSPISWKGTEKAPINIKSSDGSGQGIFVMADQKESVMEYVVFDKLTTPAHNGWTLTGAVCFYQSPVTIDNCTFKNNKSEDALNIFRSKFTLNNSHFENTSSDALDVDFSVGTISNSTFKKCTNDAVDVSGRFITLNNLTIDEVGDKAISLGENGKMVGENIIIKNSDIALVVKDLSSAEFNNIEANNVKVGVAVYCKKPQFGPGSTVLNGFKTKNVEEKYLLETHSTLAIDKKNISPNHDDVRSIFYGSVYGKASVR